MDKVKVAKISIYIMTTLILIGFIAVGIGIRNKIKQLPATDLKKTITLEENSEIKDIFEYDGLLAIHTSVKSTEQVTIIEPTSGNIIHKINIETK